MNHSSAFTNICIYVTIKIKNIWKWNLLSHVLLFATPCGQLFPSPGNLPNTGIKSQSPALWVDSLPVKLPGKAKDTGVGSHPFSRGSFWPKNWTGFSCIAGRFFTSWATEKPKEYLHHCIRYTLSPSSQLISSLLSQTFCFSPRMSYKWNPRVRLLMTPWLSL